MPPPFAPAAQPPPLYLQVADAVAKLIADGTLRPGERTPSLRAVCHQHGVSMSTAVQAFVELESRGLVEPRHKSGFFVKQPVLPAQVERHQPRPPRVPMAGSLGNLHASLFEVVAAGNVISIR